MEKVVVFTLNAEFYALPIMEIKEVVKKTELNPVPDSVDYVIGVMSYRGKVMPVIDLEKRFGLTSESQDKRLHVIVIDTNGEMFGVLVDDVSEVLQVSSENIQSIPESISKKIEAHFLRGVIVDKNKSVEQKEQKNEENQRLILYLNADTIFAGKNLEPKKV